MVVVSLVIGIGIFRTPALVARDSGGALPFLLAWVLGGLASLTGALVFAEIGSRFPRAGGYYKVVAHCWHPMPAFVLNWSQVLMQGAGAAGVAVIGAEYLLRLAGSAGPIQGGPWLAAALVGGLVALNGAGIRAGARVQTLLSAAKIVLIAGLAAAGLGLAPGHAWTALPPASGTGAVAGAAAVPGTAAVPGAAPAGMLAALVAVFYAYGGYQNTMNLAGDVRDPGRRLVRGICLGMAIVTLLYLVINVAYVRALGVTGVAASPLVAADLARAALGVRGETVVSLAIFVSAGGFVNATILHMPRGYMAMAEDRLLPAALGRLNPRTQAQGPGLAFFAATALVPLLFLRSFERLLGYVMFTDALSLAVVASCLFVLRRRSIAPAGGRAWRMPGYPVLPVLFVLVVVSVACEVAIRDPDLALAGLAVAAGGVPLYYAMRRAWQPPRGA